MTLTADRLTVMLPGMDRPAVDLVSLNLDRGTVTAVIGPNGSGKTTLIRSLAGALPPAGGRVTVDGLDVAGMTPRARARVIAVLPQREDQDFPIRVYESISLGRLANLGALGRFGVEDAAAVESAIDRCRLSALRERTTDTLSGGEFQRVRIGRCLAQEPRVLLMDEPTASLDLGSTAAIFGVLRGLAAQGIAVLVATHDLNSAFAFADRVLMLAAGRLIASCRPDEALDESLIARLFEYPVSVVCDPHTQRRCVIPALSEP